MIWNRKKNNDNDEIRLQKNIEFISWIQEFSKKIVFITFIIFLLSNIFFLIITTFQFIHDGGIAYFDTYISEVHSTFRDVIGGYLIKAATENVFKIGGSYLESYAKMKSNIITKNDDTSLKNSDDCELSDDE